MWAPIVNIAIGLWLMFAPAWFGSGTIPANNYYIFGPMVITAAITSLWEFNRSTRYFNLISGFWIALSPLVLEHGSTEGVWSSVITGVALVAFSSIKGKIKGNYGGGWQVLFKSNSKFFQDKVVVITGATGGVGRVTAWEFAKQGAKVVIIARDEAQLHATAKEIEVYGGTAITIKCDVADHELIERYIDKVEREIGPVDVLVNNAMNSVFAPFAEVTAEEFKRVTDVTYLGTVYCTIPVLKRMRRRNKGSIVFVGSALAYRGIPLQSAYCGAKHGIQGFYDSLRAELMHERSAIKTCMVQLPALNTTQFDWVLSKLPRKARPMGKVYQPEVAAKGILFAARHNRREILVGFPSYKAIIGNKIAPWYADWVLARTAYKGQQTDIPIDPNRKDNLWNPVGEDRGAYGDFEKEATNFSFTLWMSMNRTWVRVILLTMVASVVALLMTVSSH